MVDLLILCLLDFCVGNFLRFIHLPMCLFDRSNRIYDPSQGHSLDLVACEYCKVITCYLHFKFDLVIFLCYHKFSTGPIFYQVIFHSCHEVVADFIHSLDQEVACCCLTCHYCVLYFIHSYNQVVSYCYSTYHYCVLSFDYQMVSCYFMFSLGIYLFMFSNMVYLGRNLVVYFICPQGFQASCYHLLILLHSSDLVASCYYSTFHEVVADFIHSSDLEVSYHSNAILSTLSVTSNHLNFSHYFFYSQDSASFHPQILVLHIYSNHSLVSYISLHSEYNSYSTTSIVQNLSQVSTNHHHRLMVMLVACYQHQLDEICLIKFVFFVEVVRAYCFGFVTKVVVSLFSFVEVVPSFCFGFDLEKVEEEEVVSGFIAVVASCYYTILLDQLQVIYLLLQLSKPKKFQIELQDLQRQQRLSYPNSSYSYLPFNQQLNLLYYLPCYVLPYLKKQKILLGKYRWLRFIQEDFCRLLEMFLLKVILVSRLLQ